MWNTPSETASLRVGPIDAGLPGWVRDGAEFLSNIWDEGAYGLTYGDIVIVVAIMSAALLLRGVFAHTLVNWILRMAAGTKTEVDDALARAIATPLKIVPVILGIYASMQVIRLDPGAESIATGIIQSILTLTIFWTLSRAVRALEYAFGGLRHKLSPAIVDWMVKALQFILIVLGFGAVAQQWGIAIAPLLAGLGVFGIAVGLGAQDLFKNLIAGILILGEKRFVPGEWIRVEGVVEGTVEKINFRSTLIRRFDRSPVFVPNALLSDSAVTNFTRMTHRRIRWAIGVEYRTTVSQLKYIRDEIEDWIVKDDRFAKPPEAPLFVRVDEFNASSIDFLVYAFTKTINWGEWLEAKEDLAVAVMQIIERAGTSFAFPSRTIYLQKQDPPEILEPPLRKQATPLADSEAGFGESDTMSS